MINDDMTTRVDDDLVTLFVCLTCTHCYLAFIGGHMEQQPYTWFVVFRDVFHIPDDGTSNGKY